VAQQVDDAAQLRSGLFRMPVGAALLHAGFPRCLCLHKADLRRRGQGASRMRHCGQKPSGEWRRLR
jgi:hypothetical protein